MATVLVLQPALLCRGATPTAPGVVPGFKTAGEEFVFDTGLLSGRLGAEKRGFGLTSVKYSPSGQTLSRSTGLLGVYILVGSHPSPAPCRR